MSALRFEVLGFPVTVQPGFGMLLGIYLLFSLQAKEPLWSFASFGTVVFLSILLHELGHAVVARRFGMHVGGIYIHGFGGHVTHSRGPAREQLFVSLAGPGAGLLAGIPLLLLWWNVELPLVADTVVRHAVWVNVVWSLFNLFPMLPLDGGKALGSALELLMGPLKGWLVATTVGVICGVLLAVVGYYIGAVFLMMIGGYCGYTSYQARMSLRAA